MIDILSVIFGLIGAVFNIAVIYSVYGLATGRIKTIVVTTEDKKSRSVS